MYKLLFEPFTLEKTSSGWGDYMFWGKFILLLRQECCIYTRKKVLRLLGDMLLSENGSYEFVLRCLLSVCISDSHCRSVTGDSEEDGLSPPALLEPKITLTGKFIDSY